MTKHAQILPSLLALTLLVIGCASTPRFKPQGRPPTALETHACRHGEALAKNHSGFHPAWAVVSAVYWPAALLTYAIPARMPKGSADGFPPALRPAFESCYCQEKKNARKRSAGWGVATTMSLILVASLTIAIAFGPIVW